MLFRSELGISRPRVLFRDGESGREEPYETVVIDVDDEFSGTVVDKMNMRKAEMTDMRPSGGGKTRITFSAPSRGLIGYHGEFLSDTRGTGIMNRLFEKYGPHKGVIEGRKNGVLISNGSGVNLRGGARSWHDQGLPFTFRVGPDEFIFGSLADRTEDAELADGYLPIVTVRYRHPSPVQSEGAVPLNQRRPERASEVYALEAFAPATGPLAKIGRAHV